MCVRPASAPRAPPAERADDLFPVEARGEAAPSAGLPGQPRRGASPSPEPTEEGPRPRAPVFPAAEHPRGSPAPSHPTPRRPAVPAASCAPRHTPSPATGARAGRRAHGQEAGWLSQHDPAAAPLGHTGCLGHSSEAARTPSPLQPKGLGPGVLQAPSWAWGLPDTPPRLHRTGPPPPARPARAQGFEHPCTVRPWAVLLPLRASVSPRGPWGELPELPLGRAERPPCPRKDLCCGTLRRCRLPPASGQPRASSPPGEPQGSSPPRPALGARPVHAQQPLLPFPPPAAGGTATPHHPARAGSRRPRTSFLEAVASGGYRTINLSREQEA